MDNAHRHKKHTLDAKKENKKGGNERIRVNAKANRIKEAKDKERVSSSPYNSSHNSSETKSGIKKREGKKERKKESMTSTATPPLPAQCLHLPRHPNGCSHERPRLHGPARNRA